MEARWEADEIATTLRKCSVVGGMKAMARACTMLSAEHLNGVGDNARDWSVAGDLLRGATGALLLRKQEAKG